MRRQARPARPFASGRPSGRAGLAIRVPPFRQWTWGIALVVIGLVPILGAPVFGFHDWPTFWSAGATVGTDALVPIEAHLGWQRANGIPAVPFLYPAAAAYFLAPFAALPLALSFWVFAAILVLAAAGAGVAAGGVFVIERSAALLAVFAWAPVSAAIATGQTTPIALLLALVAILALGRGSDVVAGLAVSLLLYKPTLGLPLAGLLLLRGRWRAVGVVALGATAWYVLGVPASGGDLRWPADWLATIRAWQPMDLAGNADKAVSLPALVERATGSTVAGLVAGAAIVLASIPRLRRAPIVEAGAAACLIGVAASPHAWGYDAALALPIVLWAATGGLVEPWRTRLVVAAYLIVPLWLVSSYTTVSAIAVIVLGATVIWLSGAWRSDQPAGVPASAIR